MSDERIYLSKCACSVMCNGWRRPSRIRGRWVHPSNGSYQVDPLGRPYMLRAENWWILEFSPEARIEPRIGSNNIERN